MPSYVLRFDDICPTMNWRVWNRIESELDAREIRPLVAIVPDNRDDKLRVDSDPGDFWDRARGWQARGWTIGLHGYQHIPVGAPGGRYRRGSKSEFTGLSHHEQNERIGHAISILRGHGLQPTVWVAPWHAFDDVTLSVVRAHEIRIASDGPGLWPYEDDRGMVWFPQQLWQLSWLPAGVLTVCHHVNRWTDADLDGWRRRLDRFGTRFGDLTAMAPSYVGRPRSRADRVAWAMGRAGKRLGARLGGRRLPADPA